MVSENVFLFHALLLGAYVTFVYDWLRILRRVIPHSLFFVSVEDFLFWVYCGAEVFLLLHRESNGTLRWFAVLGAGLGIFLYEKCFSAIFVKYVSLMCRPFQIFLRKVTGFVRSFIRKKCRALKIRLTKYRKIHKMKREAQASERKAHGKAESCVSQETSESI